MATSKSRVPHVNLPIQRGMTTTRKVRIMQGKELVRAAFRCEEVDRIPWVPFVGCHAGSLVETGAGEYLQSEDLIVKGIQAAIDRYRPDGIPMVFDLQVEAEAFGCELNWTDENPPAVVSHPLREDKTLADLHIPSPDAARIPICLNATRRLREANPDIALYGLITGPFTLALHLQGTDIFMRMFDAVDHVHELMTFCRDVAIRMAEYYIDAGVDIVAVVDPMTSQIGPDQFRQFVTPYAAELFDAIRDRETLSSFFVCGHAQQNIEVMCDCKPDNVSIDENIPLDYVRDICLGRGISFGGNMQLTTVLLLGQPVDAQKNALACMKIGGKKGFILAPGCDLPYATPAANLEAVAKLVHDPYEQEIAETLADSEADGEVLDMSEYGEFDKVIVDIITLDSEGCAPCQYMVEAVKSVAPQFEGIVEWREHKIKYKEALVFMTSLWVKNIPTICIDGKIKFVSRIPKREELIEAIQDRIFEKLRVKIRKRRACLYLAGKDEEQLATVRTNADKAVMELGADVEVRLVTEPDNIARLGLHENQLPAIVLGRFQLKSACQEPSVAIVKEWLKDL